MARRLATEDLPKTIPNDFPKHMTGPLVWEGGTIARTHDWTFVLSNEQLDEIDLAVWHFKCKLLIGMIVLCTQPKAQH